MAGGPDPTLGGSLQVVQLTLQTAQAVAQGLDILGKISPSLMGVTAQMQALLREGLKSALQQGPVPSEPSPAATFTGMGGTV